MKLLTYCLLNELPYITIDFYSYSSFSKQMPKTLEILNSLVANISGKAVWRCSYLEGGAQYVMMPGITMMLQLCVDNWGFPLAVRDCACDYSILEKTRHLPKICFWYGPKVHSLVITVIFLFIWLTVQILWSVELTRLESVERKTCQI